MTRPPNLSMTSGVLQGNPGPLASSPCPACHLWCSATEPPIPQSQTTESQFSPRAPPRMQGFMCHRFPSPQGELLSLSSIPSSSAFDRDTRPLPGEEEPEGHILWEHRARETREPPETFMLRRAAFVAAGDLPQVSQFWLLPPRSSQPGLEAARNRNTREWCWGARHITRQ